MTQSWLSVLIKADLTVKIFSSSFSCMMVYSLADSVPTKLRKTNVSFSNSKLAGKDAHLPFSF